MAEQRHVNAKTANGKHVAASNDKATRKDDMGLLIRLIRPTRLKRPGAGMG
jgi:hypothetical protein